MVPQKGYTSMCVFYASLRFWLYGHGIRMTINYIVDSCLFGVEKKENLHFFAQSTVQESNGGSLCSFSVQVRWKLAGSWPAVLISYVNSLLSYNWCVRSWRAPGSQIVSELSSSISITKEIKFLKHSWIIS